MPRLHLAVVELDNFVAVGAANEGAAGLYRHRKDTLWSHHGWGNTRNFGLDAPPGDTDTVFLACGNGVIRTTDGGASWKVVTDWRITEVLDVAVAPTAPTQVYLATAYGVWRSPDQGETWSAMNSGIPEPQATFMTSIVADRQAPGHVVVGGEGGLFRTTNGAREWVPVGPRGVAIRDLAQSAADPALWLAGTEERGIMISRDGGAHWSFIGVEAGMGTIYAVAADPENPDRMAAAGFEGGVYLSTDGGARWRRAGLEGPRIHALIFDANAPKTLWAGTLGDGVYRTDDEGARWHYAGLDGAVIWNMDFFDVDRSSEEGVR